jgi:hypothetical protein
MARKVNSREYGLITEAHAQLSVVQNCSSECSGGGETARGGEWSAVAGGGGRTDSTQGERIWSSFQRQKVERALLLLNSYSLVIMYKDHAS